MKVCPQCGFTDSQFWRNSRWGREGLNAEVCNYGDFQKLFPELASNVDKGILRFTDTLYAYKFRAARRGPIIIRKPIDDFKLEGWNLDIRFKPQARISKQSKLIKTVNSKKERGEKE